MSARHDHLLFTALAASLLFAACGGDKDDEDDDGGDSSSYGPLIQIDDARVTEALQQLEERVPPCVATGAASSRDTGSSTLSRAGYGSSGSCGGSISVGYDHGDGDTTYTADFLDFCVTGASENVVLNGTVVAFEDGTPSDAGPVVASTRYHTEGPLEAAYSTGERLQFEVSSLTVEYGVPEAWAPGTPDASSPDIIELDKLTITNPDDPDWSVELADVRAERIGEIAEISVLDGVLSRPGEGHVKVSTPADQPIVLNPLSPESGAVIATGADGSTAEVQSTGEGTLTADVSVNGAAPSSGADCSEATAVVGELTLAIMDALPVY